MDRSRPKMAKLPSEALQRLHARAVKFEKESEILRQGLKSLIVTINTEKEAAKNITTISEEQLYSSCHAKLKSQNKTLGKKKKNI